MSATANMTLPVYRLPRRSWWLFGAVALMLGWVFRDALTHMVWVWMHQEEYSHGILIPLVSGYLVWQRRNEIALTPPTGTWAGAAIVVTGLLTHALGQMTAVFALQEYSFLLVVYGLVLAATGWQGMRVLAAPLLILLLMVPLPNFLLNNFSAQLQLISSQIGVWFIRLFGISVFVEGNVIDLGSYKLQVAEACDGLRYLFPLLTLSFLMAYLYKTALWKRVVLFASAIPVTILMNSFRIGTIGVMVEHWGIAMAEGFLHEFQGWAVFVVSAVILVLEIVVLSRVGADRRPWRELFGFDVPTAVPAASLTLERKQPAPLLGCAVVLAIVAVFSVLVPQRPEVTPARESFVSFPARLGEWTGRRDALESIYLDKLKLDDYLLVNFSRSEQPAVSLYAAWYDSQRAGQSTHSPRSCLPGGGWQISQFGQVAIPGAAVNGVALRVNRAEVELGNQKQLVYYWFQQRGRVVTNEYLVKWYLFRDSLLRQRTDGALVRLVTRVRPGEATVDADARLAEFAVDAVPHMSRYIPD